MLKSRRGWRAARCGLIALPLLLGGCWVPFLTPKDLPSPAEHTDTPNATATPQAAAPSPAAPKVDPCVVGRWHSTSFNYSVSTSSGTTTINGASGDYITFTADGTEVNEFRGTSINGTINGTRYTGTVSGTSTSNVTVINFLINVANENDHISVTLSANGRTASGSLTHNGQPSSPAYKCAGNSLTIIDYNGQTNLARG